MACLRLSLLGSFEAELDGEPVTGFATAKIQALLAYLAVEAHRAHRREVLAALLWPDWPERAARTNLRNALSKLRTAIGDRQETPPYLLITRETVQFNPASAHWLDVAAFRGLVADRDQVATDRGDDAACDRLQQAIALYRGPFLEGFSVGDSRAFEDWAFLVRERLQRRVLAALRRLIEGYERRGEVTRACELAWRWVELAPWQERAHRALMRCLALSGQRGAALAQYEICCRALKEELDVEPGEETARLYERIRDGELAPAAQKAQAQERAPPAETPVVERLPEVPSAVGPEPAPALAAVAPVEAPVAARVGLPGWVWGVIGALGTLVLLIVAGAALLANHREGASRAMAASPSSTTPPSSAGEGQAYYSDFDGDPSVAPGVTATLEGVTTVEPVQGYAGLGTASNLFGGNFLRNTTGTSGSPTRLTLTGLPPHTRIEINFLLAIIDSWDGSEPGAGPGVCIDCPDLLTVAVDGKFVFSEAFGFNGPVYDPPPGVLLLVESAPLGFNSSFGDSAYDMGHDPAFDDIPHMADTLTIEWFASGDGWLGGSDESWAIDNLEIVLHGGGTNWVEPRGGKYVDLCKDVAPPQICIRDDKTGQVTQVTSDLDFGLMEGPGWSPDGQQILFSAGSDPEVTGGWDHKLYRIQVKGPLPITRRSDLRQITSGNTNDLDPAWSPDGQQIAFHRNCGLWIVRPDGTGARMLLAGTEALCSDWPAWSPDSQQIAFSNTRAPFIELWVIDADGSDPRLIYSFDRGLEWGSPAWSPDGQQIACLYWDGREEGTLLIRADGRGKPQAVDQKPWWWERSYWPQWGG